jgi:hypothetical protein
MFLCLTKHYIRKRSGCIDPRLIDLGTSLKRVISFTPLPLCPRGKRQRYPFDRRRVGPRAGTEGMQKCKFLTLQRLKFVPLGRPSRSQSLYRLRYFRSCSRKLNLYSPLTLPPPIRPKRFNDSTSLPFHSD